MKQKGNEMETEKLTTTEEALMRLEEYVARQVSSVHGTLTKANADALDRLRKAVGRQWDAINRRWNSLEF